MYEEIAVAENLPEDEDMKEDVAKAMNGGMVLCIILRACLRCGNETVSEPHWYCIHVSFVRDNRMNKIYIPYENVGGI